MKYDYSTIEKIWDIEHIEQGIAESALGRKYGISQYTMSQMFSRFLKERKSRGSLELNSK